MSYISCDRDSRLQRILKCIGQSSRESLTILFGREVLPVCPSIAISFSAYSNLITSERKSKLTVKSIVRILLNNNTPIAAETFRKANRID